MWHKQDIWFRESLLSSVKKRDEWLKEGCLVFLLEQKNEWQLIRADWEREREEEELDSHAIGIKVNRMLVFLLMSKQSVLLLTWIILGLFLKGKKTDFCYSWFDSIKDGIVSSQVYENDELTWELN